MVHFIDVLKKAWRPYMRYALIIAMLAIFVYIGNWWINRNKKETMENEFQDVANANRRDRDAIVYFFHVDWCPHCKTALPEWNEFKSAHDGKKVNGYNVKCVDMDCTEETAEVATMMNKFNIESYPTVKMVRGNETIEFDSKITASTLNSFITMMLSD